jgi:hypothetical protein
LDKVNDPEYAMELRRKVLDLDQRTKTLTKEQKALVVNQHRRENRLERIIQKGEPEGLK